MDRTCDGRFAKGNSWASVGGKVRAAKLTPGRRREIAWMGWVGFVVKYFGGNESEARVYVGDMGAYHYGRSYFGQGIGSEWKFGHLKPQLPELINLEDAA